jgi:hypothetical protein
MKIDWGVSAVLWRQWTVTITVHNKRKFPEQRSNFQHLYQWVSRSRGSSVSIVSGYGLDYRPIEVRSPTEAKRIFPLASVSRPALWPTQPPVKWVPGVLSTGLKRVRGVTMTTPIYCRGRKWVGAIYLSPCTSIGVLWKCFTCLSVKQ